MNTMGFGVLLFFVGLMVLEAVRKKARDKGKTRKENVIIGFTVVYFVVSFFIFITVPFPTI